MDIGKLRELFLGETDELLGRLEQAVLSAEKNPSEESNLRTIFQVIHTLKGNAATMGFEKMAEAAHYLEDALEPVKEGKIPLAADGVQILLGALDLFRALAKEFQVGEDKLNIQNFLGRLKAATSAPAAPAISEPSPSSPPPESNPSVPSSLPAAAEPVQAPQESSGGGATDAKDFAAVLTEAKPTAKASVGDDALAKTTVRVQLSHLDAMMNLVGELAIVKSRLTQYSEELGVPALAGEVKFVERLSAQLQEEVLQTRLVPVDDIFQRYRRVVRDISHDLKKEINFVIQDNDISVDRVLFEKINEAVVHLLRNAIDHGIETQDERKAKGKNPVGTVSLVARKEKGYAVVGVNDDGGGINAAKIKEKALAMGILTAEAAQKMSDQEAYYLICHPNLSTKEEVTQFSGRGIGMDVVQESVESINGHLEIQSTLGGGSRFSLFLPLNLAIIQALLCRIGDHTFAMPLADVIEIVSLAIAQPALVDKKEVIVLRNEVLPLVRLRGVFGIKDPLRLGQSLSEQALVVRSRTSKFALVVDHLVGRQEVVLKNLSGFLKQLPCIGGATILGDGRAILILDIEEGFL